MSSVRMSEASTRSASKKQVDSQREFRFIDLFAGIGGMRLAFESVGGTCVFSSEWYIHAQKTY